MNVTFEEKKYLLKEARREIKSLFAKVASSPIDYNAMPVLKTKCGVFVTLTINKRLRGCIGYVVSDQELIYTLRDAAVQAASQDPRFLPIRKDELNSISLEVSILSEPFPMNNYDEIELGKHGLIVEEDGRRGLLLPQVPLEHKMNKEEFLSAICQKAGLASNLWKRKILNLELFTATVFSEEDIK